MKIKFSQIFWGSFFIILGVLFLLNQFTNVNLNFHFIKNLWPLFLIAIGLYYLKLSDFIKYTISGTTGILLGLFVFSMFNGNSCSREESNVVITNSGNKSKSPNLVLNNDTSKLEYTLNVDFGAGDLRINDISNNLIEIFETNSTDLLTIEKYDSINNIINLSSEANITLNDKFLERDAIIKLNNTKIWNINTNLGAVSASIDLSKFKVRNFDLNSGASSMNLKIGDLLDSANVNIDCGASKVKILIPKSSGCIVYTQTALSKNRFSDFNQITKEEYQTENFIQSAKKIFIKIDGGVSKYIIERY